MKKIYLLGAISGILLASCANDDLVNPVVDNGENGSDAIAFNLRLGNQSRANLEDVMNNFGVWSVKAANDNAFKDLTLNLGASDMSGNVVINDYKVYYDAATHYGSQWTYLTSDEPDSIPELQFIKYWDGSVAQNYFFAYAPHNTKHKDALVTFTNNNGSDKAELGFKIKTTSDPNYKFLYSDATVATVADYINPANGTTTNPKKVNLKFNYLIGQVRLAFWESIQGYSVELENVLLNFPKGSDPAHKGAFGVAGIPAAYNAATQTWSRGKYAETSSAKVAYSGTAYATKEISYTFIPTPVDTSAYLNFIIPTGDIGTTRGTASPSPNTYNVVPTKQEDGTTYVSNCGFQFVLNYKLKAEDTNEVIEVKGARVFVPSDYTQWERNKVYTYIFQITKDSSGTTAGTDPGADPEDPEDALYPIIFDGVTISDPTEVETDWVVNQTLAFAKSVYVVAPSGTQEVVVNLGYQVSKDNTDGKIVWTSSDTGGFTLTNDNTTATGTSSTNTITGGTAGTYTLTADYYGTKASTKVVVGTWGTLSDATKRIDDGAFNLDAPITLTSSDPEIVWTSSKPEVATVEAALDGTTQVGKVTPKSAGKTTITATLGNKTTSCKVYIRDLVIANAYAISSMVTENTVQLVVNYNNGATITDVAAETGITYTVADGTVVEVSATGLVTPKAKGETTITVKYKGMTRTVVARVNQVNP